MDDGPFLVIESEQHLVACRTPRSRLEVPAGEHVIFTALAPKLPRQGGTLIGRQAVPRLGKRGGELAGFHAPTLEESRFDLDDHERGLDGTGGAGVRDHARHEPVDLAACSIFLRGCGIDQGCVLSVMSPTTTVRTEGGTR